VTRRALFMLSAACLSLAAPVSAQKPPPPIVVLGVPAEVRDVEAAATRPAVERVQGVPFTVGVIGSQRVILGKTNAGKVNAAMMTALAITHFRTNLETASRNAATLTLAVIAHLTK
jgi:hypothetical protein